MRFLWEWSMMFIAPRQAEERALVIGFGNYTRQDDGVGYHLINALRRCLGQPTLEEDDEGAILGEGPVAVLWVQQLVPELAETIAAHDVVLLLDAHAGAYEEEIRLQRVSPAYEAALVSHHMKPSTLLAFAQDVYGKLPRMATISVRGYHFDFGTDLSPRTAELAAQVLPTVMELAGIPAGCRAA